jgi:hypothetical protein
LIRRPGPGWQPRPRTEAFGPIPKAEKSPHTFTLGFGYATFSRRVPLFVPEHLQRVADLRASKSWQLHEALIEEEGSGERLIWDP